MAYPGIQSIEEKAIQIPVACAPPGYVYQLEYFRGSNFIQLNIKSSPEANGVKTSQQILNHGRILNPNISSMLS